jgi:hypothetical protein
MLKDKAAQAAAAYEALVLRIAENEDSPEPPEEVWAILSAASKTADDLEAAVNRLHRIAELKATIATAEEEHKAVGVERAERGERLEQLRREYNALGEKINKESLEATSITYRVQIIDRKIGEARNELAKLEPKPTPPPEQCTLSTLGPAAPPVEGVPVREEGRLQYSNYADYSIRPAKAEPYASLEATSPKA